MEERDKKEERNKRIGWLTSVGVQLVLLVLFYFIVAWKEPFPPIPEYGIELGFSSSSGAPAAAPPSQESPEEAEIIEEQPQQEPKVPNETQAQDAEADQEPLEETQTTPVDAESPVSVEETESSEQIEQEIEEEVVTNEPAEETEEEVDSRAVMTSSEDQNDEVNENPSNGEAENEEERELDQRAIYGRQGADAGNVEGANLALSGWIWDFQPKPDDTSDESGKIVYKIVVDSDGYLVKIETVTSTVSPSVERRYRQAVEKLTFSKTTDYKSAAVSTGTITFIIKSR